MNKVIKYDNLSKDEIAKYLNDGYELIGYSAFGRGQYDYTCECYVFAKEEMNAMKFKEAYQRMLEGKKITRPCFKGYWFINGVSGKLTIHLANGDEITEGDLGLTLQNALAEDWQVIE